MSNYTPGIWRYHRNIDGSYSVYQADSGVIIAEVRCFNNLGDHTGEANARLIASSPETHIALVGGVELLRSFEVFMLAQRMDTKELNKAIGIIDELLDRIDGTED